MKILVIRFSSIGDIVLTTPVVRALKLQLGAEVHYLTKPQFEVLLNQNPYIDKIIKLPHPESTLRNRLKQEKYDAIIDLHNNLRSRRFSIGVSALVYRFQKLNWRKWLAVNFKYSILPPIHIVDRYLKTAGPLGIKPDDQGLDYFHGLNVQNVLENFQLPGRFAVYAIGGQYQTKKMPIDKMKELLSNISMPVVLLGGKEDEETGTALARNHSQVIQLCGKTGINESAAIISAALLVITHDSGMMHIAAAYHKKILSIWGNTIPEFGMYPYKADPDSRIFEIKDLKCRPCSKIGYNTCPKGHFNCMQMQQTEAISALVR